MKIVLSNGNALLEVRHFVQLVNRRNKQVPRKSTKMRLTTANLASFTGGSVCSEKDQFNKAKGRLYSCARLLEKSIKEAKMPDEDALNIINLSAPSAMTKDQKTALLEIIKKGEVRNRLEEIFKEIFGRKKVIKKLSEAQVAEFKKKGAAVRKKRQETK